MFAPSILALASVISSTFLRAEIAASNNASPLLPESSEEKPSVPFLPEISVDSSDVGSFIFKGLKWVFMESKCTSPEGRGIRDVESLHASMDREYDDGDEIFKKSRQGGGDSGVAESRNTVDGMQTLQRQQGETRKTKRSASLRRRARDVDYEPISDDDDFVLTQSAEAEEQDQDQWAKAPAQQRQPPWAILEIPAEELGQRYLQSPPYNRRSKLALYEAVPLKPITPANDEPQRALQSSMRTFFWVLRNGLDVVDRSQGIQGSSQPDQGPRRMDNDESNIPAHLPGLHISYLVSPAVLCAFYEARVSRWELRHATAERTLPERWVSVVMKGEWLNNLCPVLNSLDNLFDAEPRIAALYELLLFRAADMVEAGAEPSSSDPGIHLSRLRGPERLFFARPEWDRTYVDEETFGRWQPPGLSRVRPHPRFAKFFPLGDDHDPPQGHYSVQPYAGDGFTLREYPAGHQGRAGLRRRFWFGLRSAPN